MTLWDYLAVAMARWYTYHMPPSEEGAWTWSTYDQALALLRAFYRY